MTHVPFIEQEIREQPEVIARVLEHAPSRLAELFSPGFSFGVHFVGCGDMYFAGEAVSWSLRGLRLGKTRAWRSMSFRWPGRRVNPLELVVCASVSGRTLRTLEAARTAQMLESKVIAITDNPGSPIASVADHVIELRTSPPEALEKGEYAGYHHQIAQTKTFTAAMLAELLLGRWVFVREEYRGELEPLDGLADYASRVIPQLLENSAAIVPPAFEDRENVVVLGSGPYRPIAEYGAAKFLEYAIPATASCLEEFNHLEIFLANESTTVIVLVPDEEAKTRAEELLSVWENVGVRSLVVGPEGAYPGEHSSCLPIEAASGVETLFATTFALQSIAYRAADALGRDVDQWLGGVRTDLLNETSRQTIRGRSPR